MSNTSGKCKSFYSIIKVEKRKKVINTNNVLQQIWESPRNYIEKAQLVQKKNRDRFRKNKWKI